MTRSSVSLTEGLREMIASGRLTEAMLPDDFQWLIAALDKAEHDSLPRRVDRIIAARVGEIMSGDEIANALGVAPGLVLPTLDELVRAGSVARAGHGGYIAVFKATGARRAEEIERDAAERRESIRKGARRAPKAFKMESSGADHISTCAGEEEAELTGELARLRSEVERLTSERDQALGLLREATAETLSTRTAVAALRDAWRASAERAAIFATDDPQTPEQWRAFGDIQATRACADELDPEKADSFEPCELAKARTAIATMREALISAREFIEEELDNRDCAGGDESDYVNDAKCTLALVSDAIMLSQNAFPASPISEPRS